MSSQLRLFLEPTTTTTTTTTITNLEETVFVTPFPFVGLACSLLNMVRISSHRGHQTVNRARINVSALAVRACREGVEVPVRYDGAQEGRTRRS